MDGLSIQLKGSRYRLLRLLKDGMGVLLHSAVWHSTSTFLGAPTTPITSVAPKTSKNDSADTIVRMALIIPRLDFLLRLFTQKSIQLGRSR